MKFIKLTNYFNKKVVLINLDQVFNIQRDPQQEAYPRTYIQSTDENLSITVEEDIDTLLNLIKEAN